MRPTVLRTAAPTATPLPHKMIRTADGPHEFRLGVEFRPGVSLGEIEAIRIELAPTQPIDPTLDLGRPLLPEPLPLRLVVPGALVMPSEHSIDPSPFVSTEVVFHVTPLVAGPLPHARIEMLRGSKIEAIEMPMRGQGRTLPRALALLAVLVPLLLQFPTWYASEIADRVVEHQLLSWLPGLPLRESIATLSQSIAGVLATTGQAGHFSFFAFVGLAAAAFCVAMLRRPSRQMLWGQGFTIGAPPKPSVPPSYLTPVSTPDLAMR